MTFATPRAASKMNIVSVFLLILMTFAISTPANALPEVHTVTFSENASASDSVTAFETGTSPQSLTSIQSLSPRFTDAGHSFEGWNTLADGSGTSYADGSTYPFSADIGLFAQWIVIPLVHTVTFIENDSALDLVSTYMSKSAPTPLTSFANLQPMFTDSGYSFSGWNTSASGSGTSFADGSQFSFASDLSLYAQWSLMPGVPTVHTVTFMENDSASDAVSTYLSASPPVSLTLFANLQPAFVNTSHSFAGWNTSRDGGGISYSDGAQLSPALDMILYAQWTLANVDTFSFNANGGSGTVVSISAAPGSILIVPGQTGLIRAGYVLNNWNTSANGSGTKYLVGVHVTVTASIVLYAQWSGHRLAALFSAIGTFRSNSSALSPALKSQVNRIAHTIESRRYHSVTLFGYTAATGLRSFNVALSRSRAANAAIFLRHVLNLMKVHGVAITSAGEGAIAGQSSSAYSRVEVFGV